MHAQRLSANDESFYHRIISRDEALFKSKWNDGQFKQKVYFKNLESMKAPDIK